MGEREGGGGGVLISRAGSVLLSGADLFLVRGGNRCGGFISSIGNPGEVTESQSDFGFCHCKAFYFFVILSAVPEFYLGIVTFKYFTPAPQFLSWCHC